MSRENVFLMYKKNCVDQPVQLYSLIRTIVYAGYSVNYP